MPPSSGQGYGSSPFIELFGRLVVLLRREPDNVPAQKDALRQLMTVLRIGAARLETGVEHSAFPDDATLQGRLLCRRVEGIHFEHDAAPAAVLELARALADDTTPIPTSPNITVELLAADAPHRPRFTPKPGNSDSLLSGGLAETPSGRTRTMSGPVDESERLARAFHAAVDQAYWLEALHAAQALVAMEHRYPEHERRSYLLSLRRLFSREVVARFIDYAFRAVEDQRRVGQILRIAGPDAIELAIEQITSSDVVGPRKFLYDFLGTCPEAFSHLLPLLDSPNPTTVQHAVELLGRLGFKDGVRPLRRSAGHPDPRVRQAAIQALAGNGVPGLAMPIQAALETEKDPGVWKELVLALGRIESGEASNALVGIALDRKTLLKGGRSVGQRLLAVEALALANHVHAARGLERLAEEADGVVRLAAQEAVGK
jgi:hypothetical protein